MVGIWPRGAGTLPDRRRPLFSVRRPNRAQATAMAMAMRQCLRMRLEQRRAITPRQSHSRRITPCQRYRPCLQVRVGVLAFTLDSTGSIWWY